MLPDFPRVKSKLGKALTRLIRKAAQNDPLLQIPRTTIHFEGDKFSNRDLHGRLHEAAYTPIEASVTVKREDIITLGIMAYVRSSLQAAETMKEQASKMMIETMTKAVQEIGNVVDNGGRPFDFEALLRALEKVQIDFDDEGKANMPSVVLHPDQMEKMRNDKQWTNPDNQKRIR
jgi:hypothetical protein